jgi:hypothetical protein
MAEKQEDSEHSKNNNNKRNISRINNHIASSSKDESEHDLVNKKFRGLNTEGYNSFISYCKYAY